MRFLRGCGLLRAGSLLLCAPLIQAQAPTAPATPASPQIPAPESPEPVLPRGQIIIQSHGSAPSEKTAAPADAAAAAQRPAGQDAKVDVSDAERDALTFTRYDLDARLDLRRSGLSVRAHVTVRNDGQTRLKQVPMQISSTLHWDSATLLDGERRITVPLAQHRLDTDADHTGAATEVVLPLRAALAPGASARFDLFYSGTVRESGDRLARLGANASQQQTADWDAIGESWTGMRGFGDVLWYPIASPQLFLAEGNTLFTAIGRTRLREEKATIQLHLSVEYTGEPPGAAYFCGRRAALKALSDEPNAATALGSGIATAEFAAAPLGFRLPSLFVIAEPETLVDPPADASAFASSQGGEASSSSNPPVLHARPVPRAPATDAPLIALASPDPGTAKALGAAADHVASLLVDWLGPRPLSALTVLDHTGQPFQDGPLLVAPAATLETSPEAPALVYSLTHAWVQSGQPWMDEGLAQFFALLWVERENGRDAALAQMRDLMQPVALAEPDLSSAADAKPGEPLTAATDELFYRRKAAAVWWMLRDLAGEQPLRAALSAWRTQPESQEPAGVQAVGFERLLERLSGKDLGWFFADWVLRDRGLPDLSIADVATSQTPAAPGHNTGWLVAVTVRNDGGATADVPLTVRSGQFSATQRIRIPGFAQATERVLVEAVPSEVVLNDGSVPETRTAEHSRELNVRSR